MNGPLKLGIAATLLGGTVLRASAADDGTTPAPARDGTLPTLEVRAASMQDPAGPGVGYVATRSTTGTKTDSDRLTQPQSVSVVTRGQMDDLGVQTVDQALRYTPGVYSQDGTDIRFDQLSGRGFSLDSYLDGLHLYQSPRFATPRIDPYFLERMEVLHGPASVLYGQGSPGGLVNYVSKLPTSEPYHEVLLQADGVSSGLTPGRMGGGLEATAVSYAPQPARLFEPPPGFQRMEIPQLRLPGGMGSKN